MMTEPVRRPRCIAATAVVAAALLIAITGCSVVAPGVSKAQTEQKQLEQMKEHTRLLEAQNRVLVRIAEALEAATEKR